MVTDEDLKVKSRYISAFFDHLEERVEFVNALRKQGRSEEAMLLCCCYLDGLGNWMQDAEEWRSQRSFVELLRELEPNGFLVRIHIKQLQHALHRLAGAKPAKAAAALEGVDARELMSEEQLLSQLPVDTDEDTVGWLRRHLWRGTVAAIAYELLRVPSVHALGSAGAISFSETTLDGQPAPSVTFNVLFAALTGAVALARKRSEESGEWFGRRVQGV